MLKQQTNTITDL